MIANGVHDEFLRSVFDYKREILPNKGIGAFGEQSWPGDTAYQCLKGFAWPSLFAQNWDSRQCTNTLLVAHPLSTWNGHCT